MIYLINIMVVYVIYAEFHLSVSTSLFSRKQKRRYPVHSWLILTTSAIYKRITNILVHNVYVESHNYM